jgi:hypothetical protein
MRKKKSADEASEMRRPKKGILSAEHEDTAILGEEPDVASEVAAALQLAMSKGYSEKEDLNRPRNSRFAHLQAQNYSIDDKTHGEEDKKAVPVNGLTSRRLTSARNPATDRM